MKLFSLFWSGKRKNASPSFFATISSNLFSSQIWPRRGDVAPHIQRQSGKHEYARLSCKICCSFKGYAVLHSTIAVKWCFVFYDILPSTSCKNFWWFILHITASQNGGWRSGSFEIGNQSWHHIASHTSDEEVPILGVFMVTVFDGLHRRLPAWAIGTVWHKIADTPAHVWSLIWR